MKWTKLSRGAKALAVSLALGLGVSACSRDYTVAYLYVTTSPANLIDEYAVDYQLGSLVPLAASPVSSGGVDPVGLVVSTNEDYTAGNTQYVYVINAGNATTAPSLVEFLVGSNGPLIQKNSYSIAGTQPTAITMDTTNTFLYVTFKYIGSATSGTGGLEVFPINTDGSLGTPVSNTTVGTTPANPLSYYPLGNNPIGVVVSNLYCSASTSPVITKACTTSAGIAGQYTQPNVYVVDQDTVNGTPTGVILAFQQQFNWTGSAPKPTGTLAQVTGSVLNGFQAGSVPAGIAVDPTGHYLYVTDQATNQVFGDIIINNGVPSPMIASPFPTGLYPQGITIDPRGQFLYVANYSGQTVSGFAINTATGQLSGNGAAAATATGPTCVTIEPALGLYLYTSNALDGSVSGMQLDAHSGALSGIQGTPYPASGYPTCAAAAASGSHATETIDP